MSLTVTDTFDIADSGVQSAALEIVTQPAVSFATGDGGGRLIHPTAAAGSPLTYDYYDAPDETVNIDGTVIYAPTSVHTQTLLGGADTVWARRLRDAMITERWMNGGVGCPIGHLRMLQLLVATLPTSGYVKWYPNYFTDAHWLVQLISVQSGQGEYTLKTRLAADGFAPGPVELKLRILGIED